MGRASIWFLSVDKGMLRNKRMAKCCCLSAWEGRLTCLCPCQLPGHTGKCHSQACQAAAPVRAGHSTDLPRAPPLWLLPIGTGIHEESTRAQSPGPLPRPFTQRASAAIPAVKFAFLDAQFTFSIPPHPTPATYPSLQKGSLKQA